MKKDEKTSETKGILAAHKKVGKKFIPPMLQLGGFSEISYTQTILPETIWMGLLNDALGYMEGVELAATVAKIAHKAYGSEKFVNFAVCSSYSILHAEAKQEVLKQLDGLGKLTVLRKLLMPLLALYEQCPISFIGLRDEWSGGKNILVDRMKATVERHFWKHETPAMVIQANVIYVRGICGGLYYVGEVKPPDLEAIVKAPESDSGKRSASMVRASVLMDFGSGAGYVDTGWPVRFWNQGLLVDACDFGGEATREQ